jgi:two-component system chemotaxis response regulator CheY
MKTLVVEDDFTSRILMHKFLSPYGEVHIAVNGKEAVGVVREALENNQNYDLICLDVMMPEMDGHAALSEIRKLEVEKGIESGKGSKIVMTTALSDSKNVINAFKEECDAYMVKPVERAKFLKQLRKLDLIE